MSIFKSNKFFRIIKHFILALPLMFVLGTSLYAIVNPNAKDSYYGETINDVEIKTANNQYEVGQRYTLTFGNLQYYLQPQVTFNVTDVISSSISLTDIDMIIIRSQNNNSYVFFYRNGSYVTDRLLTSSTTYVVEFTYLYTETSNVLIDEYKDIITYEVYNDYSYLSNAFEYGLYQFTQIGFGQFDFVSLFNGIFTTNINNVYASFINDYINYYLFVEIIYFAPWVFHAFIHFAYDLGDYFTSSFKRNRKEDD